MESDAQLGSCLNHTFMTATRTDQIQITAHAQTGAL
jgi:hypothetical protein